MYCPTACRSSEFIKLVGNKARGIFPSDSANNCTHHRPKWIKSGSNSTRLSTLNPLSNKRLLEIAYRTAELSSISVVFT